MSNKLIASIFIISFWLLFPIVVMFMESNDYVMIDSELGKDINEVNLIPKTITTYFTILFLYIPNAPYWLNTIIMIFRLVSILVVYLLARGD